MKIIALIILISTFSFHVTEKATEVNIVKETQAKFSLDDSDYVILSYNSHLNWIFKNAKSAELNRQVLNKIEGVLEVAIIENNAIQKASLEKHNKEYPKSKWTETGFELKLDGYKRQYLPIINDKGEKEIWINFFCSDFGSDNWKSEIIIVEDGGNCYFNIKVNLTSMTYSELSINGYS